MSIVVTQIATVIGFCLAMNYLEWRLNTAYITVLHVVQRAKINIEMLANFLLSASLLHSLAIHSAIKLPDTVTTEIGFQRQYKAGYEVWDKNGIINAAGGPIERVALNTGVGLALGTGDYFIEKKAGKWVWFYRVGICLGTAFVVRNNLKELGK